MKDTRTERTGLLAALSGLLALSCIVLFAPRVTLAVPPMVFAGLFIPAAAFSIFLRLNARTWGREGEYIDLWSIPHFLLGVFAFLLGIDLAHVVVVAVAWELIEVAARVREHTSNRVTDVVLAVAGWLATHVALA
jgi:hypothetical protein